MDAHNRIRRQPSSDHNQSSILSPPSDHILQCPLQLLKCFTERRCKLLSLYGSGCTWINDCVELVEWWQRKPEITGETPTCTQPIRPPETNRPGTELGPPWSRPRLTAWTMPQHPPSLFVRIFVRLSVYIPRGKPHVPNSFYIPTASFNDTNRI
jgi:hypothetical protein